MLAQYHIIRNDQQRAEFVERLYEMPLPVEAEAKPYKRKRSLDFNSHYWVAVVTPMAAHCGDSEKETHRNFCGEYFGWIEKEFNGRIHRKPRRTTTEDENGKRDVLNWEQFSNFVEHAKMIAANMGVAILEVGECSI